MRIFQDGKKMVKYFHWDFFFKPVLYQRNVIYIHTFIYIYITRFIKTRSL